MGLKLETIGTKQRYSAMSFFVLLLLALALAISAAADVVLFSHTNSALAPGHSLSNNGSTLKLELDCDLVLRDPNHRILWNSGSVAEDVDCVFWISKYGVAVVSDADGSPLWTAGFAGHRGNYALLLRPDGTVSVYGPSLWNLTQSSSAAETAGFACGLERGGAEGNVMYSSDDFVREPAVGVLLRSGNYRLVLETSCRIHIRRSSCDGTRKAARSGSYTPVCKTQLTAEGELSAYRRLFDGEDGLDEVWLRTWGSNLTVAAAESIAALVDRGVSGELLVYPLKHRLV